jgi:WD40 repeat protein
MTLDVIITASSDRTIKLWEAKNVKTTENPCFQTIVGHNGSILDMVFISKEGQVD